jgi:hypothetical protein
MARDLQGEKLENAIKRRRNHKMKMDRSKLEQMVITKNELEMPGKKNLASESKRSTG